MIGETYNIDHQQNFCVLSNVEFEVELSYITDHVWMDGHLSSWDCHSNEGCSRVHRGPSQVSLISTVKTTQAFLNFAFLGSSRFNDPGLHVLEHMGLPSQWSGLVDCPQV